ncbi:unnamed protein product [Meloidogyne enterolobii]|uniref:Nuclear receptor domain-containing protein n=2 Tax=Meloidogyne enterolobii TaxID=390850 RepID=A0A6V7XXZ5_MELEN|nr:unnamed protein product [Meloidogyne enterolobii]
MSYIISPAFKGLSCQVCGQQSHGRRFDVLCCLPCAAFFRRYNGLKTKRRCQRENKCEKLGIEFLKKCKICRYRKCISIGMKMTKDEKILEEKEEESFFQNFIEAYEEYVTFQQKLFFNIYPEKVYQQALVS